MVHWLICCSTNRKVAGSIPDGVTGIFHWHKIPPIALWPWVRLSILQKWVPGSIPGAKGGRCIRLTTLPPSCAVVKSGNRNFLEPSGPLQACNGTTLPIYPLACVFCHRFFWTVTVLWLYNRKYPCVMTSDGDYGRHCTRDRPRCAPHVFRDTTCVPCCCKKYRRRACLWL